MRKNKFLVALVAAAAMMTVGFTANAKKNDQGVDWSKFQGYSGVYAYKSDKFAIAQLGGSYGGTFIDQLTYSSQVASAKSHGLRAHTYLWYGIGGNKLNAKNALDYYLPKVQTPKGSIVALDYEDGASGSVAANTNAILYGMKRVAAAGFTPMYYSYKPYTLAHVDYKQINKQFPNSLWIAMYPNYLVTPRPNYNYFPSMDGVAIFQFTSTYKAGGLDGNVDLTGITDNGYSCHNVETPAPATKYYSWNPRKVKATGSVWTYDDLKSRKKVGHWPKGTEFDIAKVVHVAGKVYRLQLDNGKYLSGRYDRFKNMYYCNSKLKQVKNIKAVKLYKNPERTKSVGVFSKGNYFNIKSIAKTKSGLWELKTESEFYMTANKDYVVKTK